MAINTTKKELNNLYWERGLSTITIGRRYGVSSTTIINIMEGFGIQRRTPGEYLKGHHMSEETRRKIAEAQMGEKSNNWKGGRYIDNHGYVRVVVPPNSPYFPMAHKTKNRVRCRDITEHRLIMAQHLGRCLEPWEVVHHLNGNKGDNRIENLKLMSSKLEHMPSTNWQRYVQQVKSEAYKQGRADTMKALKKEGYRFNQYTAMDCFAKFANPGEIGGWLVLIPDK